MRNERTRTWCDYGEVEEPFQAFLDESLDPRGPDSLYDLTEQLGLPPRSVALDVGCGRGRHALDLARRFGFRVHGFDPSRAAIESARAAADAAGLASQVRFAVATAEGMPMPDASADFVWCKEVVTLTDLPRAFAAFARVLRPGGVGLVYQVLTGLRMTDREARAFCEVDTGFGPAHVVRPADVEAAIGAAGLTLRERIDYGSEWGEYGQEQTGAAGRRLLHAARLLRSPNKYIEAFGKANYDIMLNDCLWHIYRMIGKLHGVTFIFSKDSPWLPEGSRG